MHAVPRGNDVAGADPVPDPRRSRPARRHRHVVRDQRVDQPRHRLAAAPDDDLPARPVGREPDRLGGAPLPPRVRALHRARPPDRRRASATRSTEWGWAPMSDDDASRRDDRRAGTAAQDHRHGHHRRRGARGAAGSARDRGVQRRRDVRAAVLLPPSPDTCRDVPAMPGRDPRAARVRCWSCRA